MALPATFDGVFKAEAQDAMPWQFLRALAYRFGDIAPDQPGGLMGISDRALDAYNNATGQSLTPQTLQSDPAASVRVAVWILGRIAKAYRQSSIAKMQMGWQSMPYLALIALGYIAGYAGGASNPGVMYIVKQLEAEGKPPASWTVPNIIKAAQSMGVPMTRAIAQNQTALIVRRILDFYQEGKKKAQVTPGSASASTAPAQIPVTPPVENRAGAWILLGVLGVPLLWELFGGRR